MRSSADLAERLEATVHSPAEDAAEVGIPVVPCRLGDDFPGNVEPQVRGLAERVDVLLLGRALAAGDVFLSGERGFRVQPDAWPPKG